MAGVVCAVLFPLVLCCPRLLRGVPCLRIRSGTPHCPVPFALHSLVLFCPLLLRVVVLLCCVRRTGGVCGVCGFIVNVVFLSFSFSSPFCLCVLCYSIVGLGLCLCDRVVSLWNSGGGLCWVEGRVVSTVYASSVLCCAP